MSESLEDAGSRPFIPSGSFCTIYREGLPVRTVSKGTSAVWLPAGPGQFPAGDLKVDGKRGWSI